MHKELLNRWKKIKKVALSHEIKDELKFKFDGEVLFDEPMREHTYIKIGGKADAYLIPKSLDGLITALKIAAENGIPTFFHGAGSNTLVKEGGIRGFVISTYNSLSRTEIKLETESFLDVEAESGLIFSRLIHLAKDQGCLSLASFIGIPGTVGGLVSMNAGTREAEIKDVVRSVTFLDKDFQIVEVSRENLEFEYRKLKCPRTHFIVKAVFRLEKNATPEKVAEEIKKYQKRRQDTQPLNFPNLGSMFKNPILQGQKNQLTAGQLIEEAGLKDVRVGGARISPKHGNFIINEGQATANDVLALIEMIKDHVKTSSGIALETEIKIIGEDL